MPAPATTFAAVLEQLRLAKGYSPADLARRLEVSPTQVSRWRRGLGVPSPATIDRIATHFGVDGRMLETLAGYRASNTDEGLATYDPRISVMFAADRAEMHEELQGIPQIFWTTILAAQRSARRLAIDNAKRAIELISLLPRSELATLLRDAGRDEDDDDRPKSVPLTTSFGGSLLVLAGN